MGTALAVVGTHVTAAGTAVSPQILDVARGAPVSVPTRMLRYWYAGMSDAPHFPGGQTMVHRMVGRRINVVAYWPVSDKAVLAALDEEIVALENQVLTRILGDSQLGSTCTDLVIGDTEVDYPVINGAQVAELTIPIILDFPEEFTISA